MSTRPDWSWTMLFAPSSLLAAALLLAPTAQADGRDFDCRCDPNEQAGSDSRTLCGTYFPQEVVVHAEDAPDDQGRLAHTLSFPIFGTNKTWRYEEDEAGKLLLEPTGITEDDEGWIDLTIAPDLYAGQTRNGTMRAFGVGEDNDVEFNYACRLR